MSRQLVLGLAALALLLSALPSATAAPLGIRNPDQPTPTTLYMHLINFQDFPINTQKPDDNFTQSTVVGATTSTTSCLPEDTPGAQVSYQFHTFYGYSSPSYVEYDHIQNGVPRTHPERGISYDAHLDEGTPFTIYWYMTTQGVAEGAGGVDPSLVPLPVPNVVVSATIRAGDAISVDDRAYNTGEILIDGATEPTTLFGPLALGPTGAASAQVTPLGQVGEQWLYEFAVPMTIEKSVIPRSSGYNLRIDVRMDAPTCDEPDRALMPNLVAIHSSAAHRPRMEFAVTNPVRLEYIHPQFVGDDLVVHVAMNSVWGNYDVAEVSNYTPEVTADGMRAAIDGPSPATGFVRYVINQRTYEHYHHQEAVDVTYLWPYKAERAANGVYTVDIAFRNDQGTAEAFGTAQFEIGKQTVVGCGEVGEASQSLSDRCEPGPEPKTRDDQKAPGLELPLMTLAAAIAVAVRRRR